MQKFTDAFAETIPFLCNNTLSEQIQQEAQAKAKAQWREENGIYQANLTPQVNADMYRYVEQKQAEINRTWSK